MRLYKTPKLVKQFWQTYTWQKNTAERKIYLTFDDGPIPVLTEYVLEVLADFNAKASFFCVGDNVLKNPGIFQKILAAGHQVGNHTFHHLKGTKKDTSTYLNNVAQCQEIFQKTGWEMPSEQLPLFRPPYGRLKNTQAQGLKKHYQLVMWSVLTYDFDATLSPEQCYQNAVAATENGAIVVFHDNWKAEGNLRYVLPRFLAHFSRQGYQFESL